MSRLKKKKREIPEGKARRGEEVKTLLSWNVSSGGRCSARVFKGLWDVGESPIAGKFSKKAEQHVRN